MICMDAKLKSKTSKSRSQVLVLEFSVNHCRFNVINKCYLIRQDNTVYKISIKLSFSSIE